METQITQKLNKERSFITVWLLPIVYGVLSIIVLPLLYEHYFTIRPEIHTINSNIQKINDDIQKMFTSQQDVENRYTKKDIDGMDCKVGVSKEMIGNQIAVPVSNNKFGLKGADKIYITNPFSPYIPTMVFIVRLKQVDPKRPTDGDFFVSKDAMIKLDIDPSNFSKGLFDMKVRTEKKE